MQVRDHLDLYNNQLQRALIYPLATDPASLTSAEIGLAWFNTNAAVLHLKVWDGAYNAVMPRMDANCPSTEVIAAIWQFNRAGGAGTAPFYVHSTNSGLVEYLNADRLDSYHGSQNADADTVATRYTGARLKVGTPVDAADAVTKAYADAIGVGLSVHDPCVAATTANIADLAAANATQDGYTCVEGNRLLVKDQTDASENGVYVFGTITAGSGPLTRSTAEDSTSELDAGTYVLVENGTVNEKSSWVQTTDNPTIDTDNIVWHLFYQAMIYVAGSGMGLTGSTFSVRLAGSATYTQYGIVYADTTSTLNQVAAGTQYQVLQSGGAGAPAWSTATFPATATGGDMLYASASNTWSRRSIGSEGNVLQVNSSGMPVWGSVPWTSVSSAANGTTNYLAKFTSTDANHATLGNSTIFDNASGVGIGTPSPASALHLLNATGWAGFTIETTENTVGSYINLKRSSAYRALGLQYYLDGTNYWIAGVLYNNGSLTSNFSIGYGANDVTVMTPTSAKMTITTAGCVGFGFTAPAGACCVNGGLHVGGTSDPLDNNLLVDGTATISSLSTAGPVITSAAGLLSSEAYLALARGGTAADLSGAAQGGVLYKGASAIAGSAAGDSVTKVLHSGIAGAPTWSQIVNADVASDAAIALSKLAAGTANYVAIYADGTGYLSQEQYLSMARGGTAANLTAVAGGVVYSGASALAISAAGTTGYLLLSGGTGAPTWGTNIPAGTTINSVAICRKVAVTWAGTSYNDGSAYIDVTHNLATHDVQVEVYRTKDADGAADATRQTVLCDVHRGSYSNADDTNKIHLHFGVAPDDDEEFVVVITG